MKLAEVRWAMQVCGPHFEDTQLPKGPLEPVDSAVIWPGSKSRSARQVKEILSRAKM